MKKHKKLHEVLGVSRSSLYYKSKKYEGDIKLKEDIEEVWKVHPSYGHKRLALALNVNKKRIVRVMKLFDIKPWRRARKPFKVSKSKLEQKYHNLLLTTPATRRNQIWVTDFTYLWYRGRFIYLATVEDIYTREVVGFSILANHSTSLIIQAIVSALQNNSKPDIIHCDQGSEYTSELYEDFCNSSGIQISFSDKGSPWQNGYQESFYGKFKIDLGCPNRFDTLGEFVYEIYQAIWKYNNTRIHTSLKMSPIQFALKNASS